MNNKIFFSLYTPISTILFLTLSFTNNIHASPPIPFDAWVVNNKKITADCPVEFSCAFEEQFEGLYQRTITDKNGNSFIQQIIKDGDDFWSESFSKASDQHKSGLSIKQTINDPNTKTTAIINTGWADTNETSIQINQTVTGQDAPNQDFISQFSFSGSRDNVNYRNGFIVGIRQEANNFFQPGNFGLIGNLGRQVFEMRKAKGIYVKKSGISSLPCTTIFGALMGGFGGGIGPGGGDTCTSGRGGFGPGGGFLPGGGFGGIGGGPMGTGVTPPGGTVTWKAGDEIATIWIGESGGNNFGGGMGVFGGSGGQFSYQSIENLSDTNTAIAYRDVFGIAGPIEWPTDPLGIEPVY